MKMGVLQWRAICSLAYTSGVVLYFTVELNTAAMWGCIFATWRIQRICKENVKDLQREIGDFILKIIAAWDDEFLRKCLAIRILESQIIIWMKWFQKLKQNLNETV